MSLSSHKQPSVYFYNFHTRSQPQMEMSLGCAAGAGPFSNSVVLSCIQHSTISKVLYSSASFNFTTRLVQKRPAGRIKPFLCHLPSSPLWELKQQKPCVRQLQLFLPLPITELLAHNTATLDSKWRKYAHAWLVCAATLMSNVNIHCQCCMWCSKVESEGVEVWVVARRENKFHVEACSLQLIVKLPFLSGYSASNAAVS